VTQYLKEENWEASQAEWAAERRIAVDAFFSEREPTIDEVLAAVAKLRQHLSPSHCPDNVSDRCLAYWALEHIVTFLFHIRVGAAILPFVRMQEALLDLEKGVTAPMLQAEKHSGADASGRVIVKATAAAIVSVLMEAGRSREEAATQVAMRLRRDGAKVGRLTTESWRTVAAWRDQATKAAKNQTALFGHVYTDCVDNMLPLPQGEPEREQSCRAALEWLTLQIALHAQ
jgi:hypothetical protein